MGKSSGSTRTLSSGSPRGLSGGGGIDEAKRVINSTPFVYNRREKESVSENQYGKIIIDKYSVSRIAPEQTRVRVLNSNGDTVYTNFEFGQWPQPGRITQNFESTREAQTFAKQALLDYIKKQR